MTDTPTTLSPAPEAPQDDGGGHTPLPWRFEGPDPFGDYDILHNGDPLAVAVVVSNLRPASEVRGNAVLLTAGANAVAALEKAEEAEEFNANCEECEGEGVPELCGACFPLFDDARCMRRAALAALSKAKAKPGEQK